MSNIRFYSLLPSPPCFHRDLPCGTVPSLYGGNKVRRVILPLLRGGGSLSTDLHGRIPPGSLSVLKKAMSGHKALDSGDTVKLWFVCNPAMSGHKALDSRK